MKISAFFGIALAMSASAFSQTSPPAAPLLTAGAEFKGLRFDWDMVPGATWYQLEYRANQTGAFGQLGDDFPATATSTRFSFPLHLYDWTYARYRLAACNSAGCTRSAAVSVSALRREAVGYFKSSQPIGNGQFGFSTDLSPDGYTLATTAPRESSGTSATASGRIFVFRRGSDRKWVQRARLEARTDTTYNNYVELHVSISASGDTVAVAIPYQVVGPPAAHRGVVDIYSWKNNVYVPTRLPPGTLEDIYSADLDDSGDLLAVRGRTATQEITAIYQLTNGVWVNVRSIPSTNETCWNVKLTADGKKVVATCRSGGTEGQVDRDYVRVMSGNNWSTRMDFELDRPYLGDSHSTHDHNAVGLDRTGDTIAVQTRDEGPFSASANVKVYHLNGAVYQLVTTLHPGGWNPSDDTGDFGQTVSISGDGQAMAVGHPRDYGTGYGPRAAPLIAGTKPTGAVYVYRLTSSWKLVNMVKPNYVASTGYYRDFGQVTSLSGTGKTLVVGMPDEDSWAQGIDGDWANAGRPGSGALFMY
jgi:hypothetical protein